MGVVDACAILAETICPAFAFAASSDADRLGEKSPIEQPYAYVSGGSFPEKEPPYSPDPLVAYRWDNPTAADELQIFVRKPVSASSEQSGSFIGLKTVSTDFPPRY